MTNSIPKHISLVSAAVNLKHAGEIDQAISLLEEALQIKSDYVPAYLLLGSFYQNSGENNLAEASFLKAYSLDSGNSEAIKIIGIFYHDQGRYIESLPYLQKLYDMDDTDSNVAYYLASTLDHIPDKSDDALEILKASWAKTKDVEIGFLLADEFFDPEDLSSSETILDEILTLSRDSETLSRVADWYCFLIGRSSSKEHLEKAQRLYLEASVLDPKNDKIWRELAYCSSRLGFFDQALEFIETAISLNPNNLDNFIGKNDVFAIKGDYQKALEYSDFVIDQIKQHIKNENVPVLSIALAYLIRSFCFDKLGRFDQETEALIEGRSFAPKDRILFSNLIRQFEASERFQDALHLIETAPDSRLRDKHFHLRIKYLHLCDKEDEALTLLSQVVACLTDEDVANLIHEAVNLYSSGYHKESTSLFRQLNSLIPDDPQISTDLAYTLIGEEKYEESEEILLKTQDSSTFDYIKHLSVCDLAYLYNITGRYQEAFDLVMKRIDEGLLADDATLHVSFFFDKHMFPDHLQFPGRSINLCDAELACAISSALALHDHLSAKELLERYSEINESKDLFLIVKGCFELAQGDYQAARVAWTEALNITVIEADKEKVNEWLASLDS